MLKIREKTFVLLTSYLAAAVLYLGGYVLATHSGGVNYANTARYGYQHAFAEVVTAVSDLDETLRRGAFATGSAMTGTVCARAYGDCLAAEMTMAALPFSTAEMEQTSGFLGRVGDYTDTLCRTAAGSGGLTDADRKTMSELAVTAAQLSRELAGLQDGIDDGSVIMDDPENTLRTGTAEYRNAATLSKTMLKYESAFPEQTELSYDGKYAYRTADMAQGDIVSQQKAKKNAAEFLGLNEERVKLDYISQSGALKYYFGVAVPDGEGSLVVTGDGRILSFTDSRAIPAGNMSLDEAAKAAAKFLAGKDYGKLKLTGKTQLGGAAVCEFAPVQNGAVCYPDMLKISIALDNGGVCAFDAKGYIQNHRDRTLPAGLISSARAARALPGSVTAEDRGLALMLSAGGKETYCYEYGCRDAKGNACTIFVNALTGLQQDIVLE
jgi:spore germination protein